MAMSARRSFLAGLLTLGCAVAGTLSALCLLDAHARPGIWMACASFVFAALRARVSACDAAEPSGHTPLRALQR